MPWQKSPGRKIHGWAARQRPPLARVCSSAEVSGHPRLPQADAAVVGRQFNGQQRGEAGGGELGAQGVQQGKVQANAAGQRDVAHDIAGQIAGCSRSVFGVMIEGHLQPGAQKFTPGKDDPAKLEYGKSITDACLGWDDSVACLAELAAAVQARRSV